MCSKLNTEALLALICRITGTVAYEVRQSHLNKFLQVVLRKCIEDLGFNSPPSFGTTSSSPSPLLPLFFFALLSTLKKMRILQIADMGSVSQKHLKAKMIFFFYVG